MHPAIQKLVIVAKAEKKQTATLAALVFVALGLWARAAVQGGSEAGASNAAATPSSTEKTSETEKKAEALETVVVPPAPGLGRDLFLPRPEDFARPVQTDPRVALGAKSAVDTDEKLADPKSSPRLTPEDIVRVEAERLTLRSTVVGAEPIAVLEADLPGKPERVVLRVGDSAFGFTLVGVHNRSARLEKSGVMVELTIPLD